MSGWTFGVYGSTARKPSGRDLDVVAIPNRPKAYRLPPELAIPIAANAIGGKTIEEPYNGPTGKVSVLIELSRRRLVDLVFVPTEDPDSKECKQPMTNTKPFDRLAPKEKEVAELIGEGLNNAEIAGRLRVGEQTVKNYSSAVIKKLGLKNRTEVALLITAAYMLPIIDAALREWPELAADKPAVKALAEFKTAVAARFPQCQ